MLSTAIIIFREILEIAMILGVVLAATRGLPGRGIWIGGGFVAGLVGAGLVAVFARAISDAASGMGQEFFNAMILFTATAVIGWTAVWVRTHAREMVAHMREVGKDVSSGQLPHYTLTIIIGLAILREGSEIVLFIYGMALSGQSTFSIVTGSILGTILGIIVGTLLYIGLIKMSVRYMLNFTGWLLILLVAGLSSQGAGYLTAAGYFNSLSTPVWNTSWLLDEGGYVGMALHTLIGYSARPSSIQLIFYFGTLFSLLGIIAFFEQRHKAQKTAIAIAAIVLLSATLSTPGQAIALDEIYSPITEYKEYSFEYNGSRTFDNDPAKNDAQSHEFALEAGVTPRLMLEVSGSFDRDPQMTSRFDATELEARYQFFEAGEKWLDAGMLVAYDYANHKEDADSLEVKLLLQKDVGRFTSTANIGFDQGLGPNATGGPDYVFLWNTRYRYSYYLQPGIEIQSDLGQDGALSRYNEQEHYIGPSLYGHIIPHLSFQAAWLAGISESSASSAARILLEFEQHF